MTQIMTPSHTTTAGQIEKAVANYRALLEKRAKDYDDKAVQTVLGQTELAGEQFAVFRRRVEAISALIVRTVTVNRTRTGQEALDATAYRPYTERTVVDRMPKALTDEAEVIFFKPDLRGRNGLSHYGLDREYKLRGLKPADPFSLAAVNEDDPYFANQKPNCTQWKDGQGSWCCLEFSILRNEHNVYVNRLDRNWNDSFWFAGCRK